MGELIHWYKPTPKPKLVESIEETTEDEAKQHTELIKETLNKVLSDVEHLDNVIVLLENKYGGIGFISTMDGVPENYTFVARLHRKMLDFYDDDKPTPPKVG